MKITISIYSETWTQEDLEHGEPSLRGIEVDAETVNLHELLEYAWEYGTSEPSSSIIGPRDWFSSVEPRHSREYIERGTEVYYSLHIDAINGHEPTKHQMQRIAGIIK